METEEKKPDEDKSVKTDDGNTTKIFIVAAIVLLGVGIAMFLLSRGPADNEDVEKVEYNQFIFEKYAGLWNTQWQDADKQLYNLRLHYNPFQVENISISGKDTWDSGSTTYITFDPDGKDFRYIALSAAELSLNMYNAFGIAPVAACTSNASVECASRPIVSCDNIPENSSAIYLRHVNPTGITISGRCAIIQGDGPEVLRASERAIYQWYGIIRK